MVIGKLFRQHNAVVMTVQKIVLQHLNATAGDYVGIELSENEQNVTMFKIAGKVSCGRKTGKDIGG